MSSWKSEQSFNHHWTTKKISKPTQCFFCRKAIWAPFISAYECKHCFIIGHQKCAIKTLTSCDRIPIQNDIPIGVLKVRIKSSFDTDPKKDLFFILSIANQHATTLINFGIDRWDQCFTFIVTLLCEKNLKIQCFAQEFLLNEPQGSCTIPNITEYLDLEDLVVDLQKDGEITKMGLRMSIEYHRYYPYDIECEINKKFLSSTKNTKRRHSNPTNKIDLLNMLKISFDEQILNHSGSNNNFSQAIEINSTNLSENQVETIEPDKKCFSEFTNFRDHFGFQINKEFAEIYLLNFEFNIGWMNKQWFNYTNNLNKIISVCSKPLITREMIGFAKLGIPLSQRSEIWQYFSFSKYNFKMKPGVYEKFLNEGMSRKNGVSLQIEKDLKRTFVDNPMLSSNNDIKSLENVLIAYSVYNIEIGYCQSLNFIAALFLMLMDEEEAFWLLVYLLNDYMPDYYSNEMIGIKVDSEIVASLLEQHFPRISENFLNLGLPLTLMVSPWFLCMFVTILPVETTMRIFDWIFSEGSHILFSVVLALFDLNSQLFTETNDFDSIYFNINSMTSQCFDANTLLNLASTKYPVDQNKIKNLRNELKNEFLRKSKEELLESSKLTSQEFISLTSYFQGSNSNQNFLNKQNFLSTFSQIFPDFPTKLSEAMFETLDEDNDDILTLKQLFIGISSLFQADTEKRAAMWFRVFDLDNDGLLDSIDIGVMLSLILNLINKRLDSSWIDEFLDTIQKNHQGKMNKKEFIQACYDMPILSEWLKFGSSFHERIQNLSALQ